MGGTKPNRTIIYCPEMEEKALVIVSLGRYLIRGRIAEVAKEKLSSSKVLSFFGSVAKERKKGSWRYGTR